MPPKNIPNPSRNVSQVGKKKEHDTRFKRKRVEIVHQCSRQPKSEPYTAAEKTVSSMISKTTAAPSSTKKVTNTKVSARPAVTNNKTPLSTRLKPNVTENKRKLDSGNQFARVAKVPKLTSMCTVSKLNATVEKKGKDSNDTKKCVNEVKPLTSGSKRKPLIPNRSKKIVSAEPVIQGTFSSIQPNKELIPDKHDEIKQKSTTTDFTSNTAPKSLLGIPSEVVSTNNNITSSTLTTTETHLLTTEVPKPTVSKISSTFVPSSSSSADNPVICIQNPKTLTEFVTTDNKCLSMSVNKTPYVEKSFRELLISDTPIMNLESTCSSDASLVSTSTPKPASVKATSSSSDILQDCVQMIRVSPDTETSKPVFNSTSSQTKRSDDDMIFDNVSAIVAESVLVIPGMRLFILHKLPTITGVMALQTGQRIALSGKLMSLLSSWTLLEKMSKLFHSLEASLGADHSYTDKFLDFKQLADLVHYAKNTPNSSPLSKLSSFLKNLDPKNTSSLDMEDKNLAECVHAIKQTIETDRLKDEHMLQEHTSQVICKSDILEEPQEANKVAEITTSENESYICEVCERNCFSQVSLACHMAVSHATDTNSCSICNETFPCQTDLLLHISKNHENKSEQKYFKCSICHKAFCKQRYLNTHLRRHAGIKNHECPVCGWKFFERTKLKWHMETHKEADQRNLPYQCNVCSKSFYNRPAWSDHMNTHSGQKPFKCTICSASFGHRMGLKRHELIHQKECQYSCNYCGKGFKMASKLKEHVIRHTGIGNSKCKRCGKVYTTNSSLKRHNCSVNLSSLVEYHQDQDQTLNNTPQYMCGECNALFMNLEDAEIHSFTHSAEPSDQGFEIELSNGTSKLVYVKQEFDESGNNFHSNANMALVAVDGGYVTCQEDLSSISNIDEQIVASTLADLSASSENMC